MEDSGPEILAIAKGIVAGEVRISEGAIRLARLAHKTPQAERDASLRIFIGIDSELDRFPFGDVRKQWAPEALERADKELHETEERFRTRAMNACLELIKRFEKTGV